jgi:hypothetical protein
MGGQLGLNLQILIDPNQCTEQLGDRTNIGLIPGKCRVE